jgi:SAM-dependent methyltransferase
MSVRTDFYRGAAEGIVKLADFDRLKKRVYADPKIREDEKELYRLCEIHREEDFFEASFQLVLTFVADAEAAVGEMRRVARPGGRVAACVWDYQREMVLLRAFWDAAGVLDPDARQLDEGMAARPCDPARLAELWAGAGWEITLAVLVPSVRTPTSTSCGSRSRRGRGRRGVRRRPRSPPCRRCDGSTPPRRPAPVRAHRPGVGCRHR